MKKAILFIATTIAIIVSQNAAAQYKIDTEDSKISLSDKDSEVMNITSNNGNDFSISIAGFEFTFGPDNKTESYYAEGEKWDDFNKKMNEMDDIDDSDNSIIINGTVNGKKKTFRPGVGYELGFSMLDQVDYAAYTDAENGFLDLDHKKSIHMSFPLLATGTWFDKRGTIGFTSGIILTCDNYTFSKNIGLSANAAGVIHPYALDQQYKKTKLTTAALRVPVMLTLRLGDMRLTGGIYGETLINSHTKIKFPKEKAKLDNLNSLRYGFYARAAFSDGFYIYGEMSRTPLFKTDKGPEALPCSVGIGFNW